MSEEGKGEGKEPMGLGKKKHRPVVTTEQCPLMSAVISPRRRRREEITNRKGGEEVRPTLKNKKPQGKLWFVHARVRAAPHKLVPFTAYEVS